MVWITSFTTITFVDRLPLSKPVSCHKSMFYSGLCHLRKRRCDNEMRLVPYTSAAEASYKPVCDHPESRLLQVINSIGRISHACYCAVCGKATTDFLPRRLIHDPDHVQLKHARPICIDSILQDERKAMREDADRFRANYLKSPQWQRLRGQVWKRAVGVCERCGTAPIVDTHHKTYERSGNELLDDLLGVCRMCHETIHGIRRAA